MITVLITYTAKSPSPKDCWRRFHEQEKHFEDMSQAKEWIQQEYFYCKKKVPIYQDTKQGVIKCGHIYCYKEKEHNRNTGKFETHYRQDWLSFYDVKTTPIAV
jgi:hypothetical protein